MHFDLSSLLSLLILASVFCSVSASHSKLSQLLELRANPECSYPHLKDRLLRMIRWNEPEAFDIILHSECRGRLDTSNINHCHLFDHLLKLSKNRDVTPFLNSIMKDESYTPLMFTTWSFHRPLVPLPVLSILKSNFKQTDSSIIFWVSLQYPPDSPERSLMNDWLVELQRPMLNWPFSQNHIRDTNTNLPSPRKTKSSHQLQKLNGNPHSWSDFVEVTGITRPQELLIEESKNSAEEISSHATSSEEPNLRFGHIYGWLSKKNNPIVRNSQDLFNLCGHSVKLHDTFLSFASPQFPLEDFAKSAKHPSKSFFEINNGALKQKVKQSAGHKNFAACRLKSGSKELQTMIKGDLMLVVLGQQEKDGQYDYKYPKYPYDDLLNSPREFMSLSMEVAPTDIVLFLPRSLFSNSDNSISPHDIPGSFHYTDLDTFASMFVNFINFVHYKTNHKGLIAVGGFVHTKN